MTPTGALWPLLPILAPAPIASACAKCSTFSSALSALRLVTRSESWLRLEYSLWFSPFTFFTQFPSLPLNFPSFGESAHWVRICCAAAQALAFAAQLSFRVKTFVNLITFIPYGTFIIFPCKLDTNYGKLLSVVKFIYMTWLGLWEIDGTYGIFPCHLDTIYDLHLSAAGIFMKIKQNTKKFYDTS